MTRLLIDIENAAQVNRQVQDLVAAFKNLPFKIARRFLRRAVKNATAGFDDALRAATPYRTGMLMRSVNTKTKVYKRTGSVASITGFSRGSLVKKRGQFVVSGSGHHALLVERGTKDRKKKNGASCGRMDGRRMMEHTTNARKNEILTKLAAELATALEKAAAESAKGGGK